MRVLGIDPGFDRCGIAVVTGDLHAPTLIHSECATSDAKATFPERLCQVGERVKAVITEHAPDAVAFERLFFNANTKTAMQVAEVRGMLQFIAQTERVPILEYSPQDVKIAVTGYGKSDKQAVAAMVGKLLPIAKAIKYDDEYDAIAIALTAVAHLRNRGT